MFRPIPGMKPPRIRRLVRRFAWRWALISASACRIPDQRNNSGKNEITHPPGLGAETNREQTADAKAMRDLCAPQQDGNLWGALILRLRMDGLLLYRHVQIGLESDGPVMVPPSGCGVGDRAHDSEGRAWPASGSGFGDAGHRGRG